MKRNLLLSLFALVFSLGIFAQDPALHRQIDGAQNNPVNPEWGAAGTALIRLAGNGFSDSISAPAGDNRPNPRYLSNLIFTQPELTPDPMTLSDFTWVFGQFMDHDLGLTTDNDEALDIDVPQGDVDFDPLGFGTVKIHMRRNAFMEGTGTSPQNPREYMNNITAFIDGSAVYGSDLERAAWLRSFEGGKLKVSAGNLLPYNTIDGEFDSEVDPNAPGMADDVGFATRLFVAGDIRANENPLLTSFHTLFVREHNRQCDLLAQAHPDWSDEDLYLHARKIVGGLIQSVTYNEWLPTMGVDLAEYAGFNPEVNPQLTNTFTAAAFRMGHTLLNGTIRRVDVNGNVLPEGNLPLRFGFFNPGAIAEVNGLEPYLSGMAQQTQQSMDSRIVDDVRNFLFGPPGAGGLDLAAINIMRGRERGLPSFNDIREAYGLPRIMFMGQITPEIAVYSQIFEAYFGDVEKIDPWVAMLAEQEMSGRLFGPTIMQIMRTQFSALRDGDRFFYLNDPVLSEAEKNWIDGTTMRDIIVYNTNVELMQDNVFLSMPFEDICTNMTTDVSGQVAVHTTNADFSQVEVDLISEGETTANIMTSNTGYFGFADLPACEAVSLRPSYTGDSWINGLTIQDIIIISRHILGLQDITSPYQLLAADADLDGSIRVQDIIRIRRLILDLDQELPGDLPMWNFVPANYVFTDALAPWDDVYPTSLDLNNPTMMVENQNFIAFKRGDVNATAEINANDFQSDSEFLARASMPGMTIEGEDVQLKAGQETTVLLRLLAHEELAAYQYSLGLTNATITDVDPLGLAPEFMNLTQRGNLRFCGQQSADEILLSLRIVSNFTASLSDLLSLRNDDLPAFAMSTDQEPLQIDLDFKVASPLISSNTDVLAFPNPFVKSFTLKVPVQSAGPAQLNVYDLNGRLLLSERRDQLESGTYNWQVNASHLPSGQYAYQVITAAGQYQGQITAR